MGLEQVVAMILKNIKEHASKQAGTDIRDVVLTVPAHWGFNAKMSLVNAAYLADLSVLSLINENSAAAIQYAITRNDTDPLNVMFFNLLPSPGWPWWNASNRGSRESRPHYVEPSFWRWKPSCRQRILAR